MPHALHHLVQVPGSCARVVPQDLVPFSLSWNRNTLLARWTFAEMCTDIHWNIFVVHREGYDYSSSGSIAPVPPCRYIVDPNVSNIFANAPKSWHHSPIVVPKLHSRSPHHTHTTPVLHLILRRVHQSPDIPQAPHYHIYNHPQNPARKGSEQKWPTCSNSRRKQRYTLPTPLLHPSLPPLSMLPPSTTPLSRASYCAQSSALKHTSYGWV
jgi:hypothetical protein